MRTRFITKRMVTEGDEVRPSARLAALAVWAEGRSRGTRFARMWMRQYPWVA